MEFIFASKFEIFLIVLILTPVFIKFGFIRRYLLKLRYKYTCSSQISSIALAIIFVFDFKQNYLALAVTIFAFSLFFISYAVAMCILDEEPVQTEK